MKTILHISKYYFPHEGGIESVAKLLVDSLPEYKNIVICFSEDKKNHHDIVDGVDVFRIGVQYNYLSQDLSISYLRMLRKLIRNFHPDAIHLHAPNPFVYPFVKWLKPRNCKLVLHWHSDILGKGKAYKFVQCCENRILAMADIIIVTSPNYIYDSIPLRPYIDKIYIIPNCVDPRELDKQPNDEAVIETIRNQYPGKKIVLFVGRHIYYKGLDLLIQCDTFIKSNVQILIAGDGPLNIKYRELAANHPRIKFIGKISQNKRRQYLWASDIFAFPSINKAEAFGVALAEAMYCKTVPIVFHIPGSGVNWVNLDKETGIEVPMRDIRAFAKAIDCLANDDTKRLEMGEMASQRIQDNFTKDKVSQYINALYDKLFLLSDAFVLEDSRKC